MTQILAALQAGNKSAAAELLPVVYNELRKLAANKLAGEQPGQTLQATALVHEAYIRLLGSSAADQQNWENRGHFFAAAAEAMRRILIDQARHKQALKGGGPIRPARALRYRGQRRDIRRITGFGRSIIEARND